MNARALIKLFMCICCIETLNGQHTTKRRLLGRPQAGFGSSQTLMQPGNVNIALIVQRQTFKGALLVMHSALLASAEPRRLHFHVVVLTSAEFNSELLERDKAACLDAQYKGNFHFRCIFKFVVIRASFADLRQQGLDRTADVSRRWQPQVRLRLHICEVGHYAAVLIGRSLCELCGAFVRQILHPQHFPAFDALHIPRQRCDSDGLHTLLVDFNDLL